MNTSITPFIKGTILSVVLVLGLSCGLALARDEVRDEVVAVTEIS